MVLLDIRYAIWFINVVVLPDIRYAIWFTNIVVLPVIRCYLVYYCCVVLPDIRYAIWFTPGAVSPDVLHFASLRITLTVSVVVGTENWVVSNLPFLLDPSSLAKMPS